MTDKIIIDGVDVSGCKHFCLEPQIPEIPLAGYSEICTEEYVAKECRDNPNCDHKQLKRKEEECKKLKWYLNEIRNDELKSLDIDWDEYETGRTNTEYTNIITLVERALGEVDD